jgi:hypothetical protein
VIKHVASNDFGPPEQTSFFSCGKYILIKYIGETAHIVHPLDTQRYLSRVAATGKEKLVDNVLALNSDHRKSESRLEHGKIITSTASTRLGPNGAAITRQITIQNNHILLQSDVTQKSKLRPTENIRLAESIDLITLPDSLENVSKSITMRIMPESPDVQIVVNKPPAVRNMIVPGQRDSLPLIICRDTESLTLRHVAVATRPSKEILPQSSRSFNPS